MLEISVGGNTHRVAVAVSDSEGERVCEGLALNLKYRLRYVTEKGKTEKTLRGIRAVEGYLELSSPHFLSENFQMGLSLSIQLLHLDQACVEDFIGYLTNRSHRLIFHQGL